jgi:hypothetical protein
LYASAPARPQRNAFTNAAPRWSHITDGVDVTIDTHPGGADDLRRSTTPTVTLTLNTQETTE